MYVTEEIFEIRHGILRESMIEAGVPDALHKRWLDFDLSFKPVIVKRSIGDCEGRYGTDPIISIPRPA